MEIGVIKHRIVTDFAESAMHPTDIVLTTVRSHENVFRNHCLCKWKLPASRGWKTVCFIKIIEDSINPGRKQICFTEIINESNNSVQRKHLSHHFVKFMELETLATYLLCSLWSMKRRSQLLQLIPGLQLLRLFLLGLIYQKWQCVQRSAYSLSPFRMPAIVTSLLASCLLVE